MAVKIRLTRFGRKNRPYYRIVVTDSRSARDGAFIEWVGSYDPVKGEVTSVKRDRIKLWLERGAEISQAVKRILKSAPTEASGGQA